MSRVCGQGWSRPFFCTALEQIAETHQSVVSLMTGLEFWPATNLTNGGAMAYPMPIPSPKSGQKGETHVTPKAWMAGFTIQTSLRCCISMAGLGKVLFSESRDVRWRRGKCNRYAGLCWYGPYGSLWRFIPSTYMLWWVFHTQLCWNYYNGNYWLFFWGSTAINHPKKLWHSEGIIDPCPVWDGVHDAQFFEEFLLVDYCLHSCIALDIASQGGTWHVTVTRTTRIRYFLVVFQRLDGAKVQR